MENKSFTVSEINAHIGRKFKMDNSLKNILVKGEISNYKDSHIHTYFTLKDEKSKIPCVMYKYNKDRFLNFQPENGMSVIIKGKIEVYEKEGKYQLVATKITEDGVGNLHIAFEQLKKKLRKEGLFDEDIKKKIPKYPHRIGVVTAKTGSVIKDIMTIIKRKYPICEILIFSAAVQGNQAASQIVKQIRHAQNYDLDTLIIARGGGSIEELWPFNEEEVARAIYECEIPVISAIGHETDFTISDFVADLRAPTPTAAADFAVPELEKVKADIRQLNRRANKSVDDMLMMKRNRLDNVKKKNLFKNPESIYEIKGMNLDNLINRLKFSSKTTITENRNRLVRFESSPIFKNPESIYEIKGMNLDNLINRLKFSSKTTITENRNRLVRFESSPIFKNPESIYNLKKMGLDRTINKLYITSNRIIVENKNRLFKIENSTVLKNPKEITKSKRDRYEKNLNKLEVLNPLSTLKRGYAIAKVNDRVISSAKDVKSGDEVDIKLNDGTINTKVI